MPRCEGCRQAGFTLVEAVMVIALTGVLAAVAGRFIVQPVQAYLDTRERAELAEQAAGALHHIARELRAALPNSARVSASGRALEFIPTTAVGRYATEGAGRLDFGSLDTGFDLMGPALEVGTAQWAVFYNLGPGVTGSDAYAPIGTATEQADANRRALAATSGSVTTIGLSSAAALPAVDFAPPYRVHLVGQPVTFRCDLAAGTLVRHGGYGFSASQADPPTGGSTALLATGVSDCTFRYEAALAQARAGLVTLRLALRRSTGAGSETVTLHHAVHVDNLP